MVAQAGELSLFGRLLHYKGISNIDIFGDANHHGGGWSGAILGGVLSAKFVHCSIYWLGVNICIADCLWSDNSTAGSGGIWAGIIRGTQFRGIIATVLAQHAQSDKRRLLAIDAASLASAGCAIRIYTTIALTDSDPILLGTFAAAFLLNSALLFQILYYGVFVEGLSPVAVFMADVKSVERTRSTRRSDMEMEDEGEIEMFARDEEAEQV